MSRSSTRRLGELRERGRLGITRDKDPNTIRTSDPALAAKALADGKNVELRQVKQVSTLLDELARIVAEAKEKGDQAPVYDLCKVTVKGTSLFCVESKGIPRVQMPQLSGVPKPGSKGSRMKANDKGEIDLSDAFREHLLDKGYEVKDDTEKAAFLKASQNELNGAKVAGMVKALEAGKLPPGAIYISGDNYVIDGHHRWAANVGFDAIDGKVGDIDMDVIRVDLDVIELLKEANDFAELWGIPQAGVGVMQTGGDQKEAAKKAEPCGCGGGTTESFMRFPDLVAKVSSRTMPDLERVPGKQNWVDHAGGLPDYIERIAKHLHYERGMTIGHAIATAVNRCKKWASGVGNVNPDTRAKAAKAIAQWEAKKVKAKTKKTSVNKVDKKGLPGHCRICGRELKTAASRALGIGSSHLRSKSPNIIQQVKEHLSDKNIGLEKLGTLAAEDGVRLPVEMQRAVSARQAVRARARQKKKQISRNVMESGGAPTDWSRRPRPRRVSATERSALPYAGLRARSDAAPGKTDDLTAKALALPKGKDMTVGDFYVCSKGNGVFDIEDMHGTKKGQIDHRSSKWRSLKGGKLYFGDSLEAAIDHLVGRTKKGVALAEGNVAKFDTAKQMVFGWAYVTHDPQGVLNVDKSGEFVDDSDEIEDAAYNFVLKSRSGDIDHTNVQTSTLVESIAFTPEKIEKMGLPPDTLPTGWWVGFKIHDPDVWARRDEFTSFSIFGAAKKETVDV